MLACSDPTDTSDHRVSVVQIAQHNVTLSVGDSIRLALLPVLPPGSISQNVRWSSSDPTIVTVRREGSTAAVVTSLRAGSAVVYANADDARDSAAVIVQ
jgi:uncharacterized protein YjdB